MKFPENDLSKEILEESRKAYCTPKEEVERTLVAWDEAGQTSKVGGQPKMEAVAGSTDGTAAVASGASFDAGEPVFDMPML